LKIFDNTGIVIEVEKTVTKTDYIDPDDIPESDFSNSKTIIVKESDFSDVKTVDEPDIVSPEVDSSGTDDNVKYNDEV